MDRRQQKTRQAIFQALSRLLKIKDFNHITVQNIISEANIGRSTFYAHFETKDDLLKAWCSDIFTHIFSDTLSVEKTHDFTGIDYGLLEKITHLLYHLRDQKSDILGILPYDCDGLFMGYFKNYLIEMFSQYLTQTIVDVPQDFLLNHLLSSFGEAIFWWIKRDMQDSPEQMAAYYMSIIPLDIS